MPVHEGHSVMMEEEKLHTRNKFHKESTKKNGSKAYLVQKMLYDFAIIEGFP